VLTENGVDTSVFFPDQQRRLTTRRVLGIEDSAFVSLLVGGDWALRGVELAIRSLVDLPETSTLIIVGRGDQQQMRMLSQSLGLGHRVRFLGERHDLDDLYRAADALIQMSAYETFSLVLVEAALTKVPLISTNVGVAPVLCGEDHSGGIMVDRDPHALAAAVRSVMENYEVAIHRADVAFDRAQRYSLSRSAHELDVVYQALLETT
jgi:glycosyltransferase involved in cell wall biosynthesis